MAKRIAIVLSQSKGAGPTQRELEGSIVAELLMVHGLEVTLVTDLTSLDDDDTGILCLEGITGDMVMLSWIQSADAHRSLAERGIYGRLGRSVFDGGERASAAMDGEGNLSPRTIYHVDLRSVPAVKDCCAEIERIRNEASVQVVGLGAVGAVPPSVEKAKDPTAAEQPTSPSTTSSSTSSSSTSGQQAQASSKSSNESDEVDDDDPELDELMEQFDAWDI